MKEKLQRALEAATAKLHEHRTALDAAHRSIDEAGENADLAALEQTFDEAAEAFDTAAAEVERCKGNLQAEERRERILNENPIGDREPANHARAKGGRVELTYRPDKHRASDFVRDAYNATFGHNPEAAERMHRNNVEQSDVYREKYGREMRDVGTGAFAGLTVPQYLLDEYAPLARAGAPLMAALKNVTKVLPEEGMVISISRLTTGSAVAAQASENSAVQETDADDTKLDVDIRQYAGQQDLSRQSVQRSSNAVDAIFEDLFADWFTKVDSALISGAGTSGTVLGIRSTGSINSVTYTDASPTLPEAYPKIADAIQQIATGRHAPALLVLMHGRRWGWATAALDSQSRPLVVPNAQGPFNALAVGDALEYGAVVGSTQGLPIITDNNIPINLGAGTNEDVILVLRTADYRLWLDAGAMPRTFTFEQTANAPATIRLAVWGEVAFTAGRYPASSSVIGGTGLVTPTF